MAGGLYNVKLGCRFTLVVFGLRPVIKLIGIGYLLFYSFRARFNVPGLILETHFRVLSYLRIYYIVIHLP